MLFNFAAMYLRTLFHIFNRILLQKRTAKHCIQYQTNAAILLKTTLFSPTDSYSSINIDNAQKYFSFIH